MHEHGNGHGPYASRHGGYEACFLLGLCKGHIPHQTVAPLFGVVLCNRAQVSGGRGRRSAAWLPLAVMQCVMGAAQLQHSCSHAEWHTACP